MVAVASFAFAADKKSDPPSPNPQAIQPSPAPSRPNAPRGATLGSAAARRNENVAVNAIDNDVAKEANIRLGVNYTVLNVVPVESSSYARELGKGATEVAVLRPTPAAAGFHGELFYFHQNSVFNARTFFQVGGVKPSRQSNYGGRFTTELRGLGALTGTFSQRKIRGMVNGNVLVPLANERTATATDPALRALITRFLAAYPNELPNRPDFDERALNTNAPQRTDEIDGTLRLDRALGSRFRLLLSHTLSRQRVSAFQLVAGQNPDTDIHSHRSRATLVWSPNAATGVSFGAGFTRNASLLVPEPNAVGPRVRMGFQIEELGPDSHFPIDRALNTFRYGFVASHRRARHTFTFGGDAARLQLNGIETNNARGLLWFTSNFGRTAIENLRAGAATTFEGTVGEYSRGYRQWSGNAFFGDQWRVHPRLQIYWGVRYNAEGSPNEVNRWEDVPYGCDCNNISPRFHIAWQAPHGWMLRTGYTISFDAIPPVTYGQLRYNPPHSYYIQVQNPDPLDPLRNINLQSGTARSSPTYLDRNLASPYVHQYSFSLERRFKEANLRLSYFGSRTVKLLNVFQENRAEPIPGIPLTTATVDARRPDPRFYDIKYVLNAGLAYLDGAQVAFDMPRWRGITGGFNYTFSKAIDEGSDYTTTAANRDISRGRAQAQYESLRDRRGLSNFDSPHALIVYQAWDFPKLRTSHRWLRLLANDWQWNHSMLWKSGTPATLYVGSDAPGFGNVDGGPSDRPNILDPSILGATISHPDVAGRILSRDKFGFIIPGDRRGSLGKGTFRRARIGNWNGGVSKRWRIPGAAERIVLFRAEAFNLSNTPQFDEPNRNLNASVFGKITNTLNDGRIFQFGLRFIL